MKKIAEEHKRDKIEEKLARYIILSFKSTFSIVRCIV